MGDEAVTTKIAREFRKKFPSLPTLTLARTIYVKHPEAFTNIEHVRTTLRMIEGKKGEKSKKSMKDKSLVIEEERPRNPYKLPASDAVPSEPYFFPETDTNVLLLADIHVPYHDIDAITLAIDYGKDHGVNTILLNGDLIDCYQISRFQKDPRKRSLAGELEATRQFLEALRGEFPQAHIIYKIGNHDLRYANYIMTKAPELLGINEIDLKNLLKLKEFGVDVVEDKQLMKLKNLTILHGHEFGGNVFNPVNVARGLFNRANAIAIQSHSHQTSEHTTRTINGDMITTWSTGCLSDLTPEYRPLNPWNLGFAHINVTEEGFQVYNKRITKGQIV